MISSFVDQNEAPSTNWPNRNFLDIVTDPSLNIKVWKRDRDLAVHEYIQQTEKSQWDDLEVRIRQNEIDVLDQLLEALPEAPELFGKQALVEDIKLLTNLFFHLEHREAKINLELIDYDMCKLFHVDRSRLRLLCTYRGEGTEWVPNHGVDRNGLGKGCNSKIVTDDSLIQQLNDFDVGILKGELFPNNSNYGVVHRSPSVLGSSQPWRVLLRIDSADK